MLLYIIETIDKKAIKVGIASEPDFRLRGFQTTSSLRLAAKYPCDYSLARALNRGICRVLAPYRIHVGWYALSAAEALQIIQAADITSIYRKRANWLDRYLKSRESSLPKIKKTRIV